MAAGGQVLVCDAQLVVLAARTGMAVMPGTVSQYVLLKSHCPVTIVSTRARTKKAMTTIRDVAA